MVTTTTTPIVLIGVPTSDRKKDVNYPWAIFCKNSLTYPNRELFAVDNSFDTTYHRIFKQMGIETAYVSPKGKLAFQVIAECQNLIRQKVLREKFDYLFFLETDLLYPPIDIIERLLAFQVQVVGCMYLTGTEQKNFMINHICEDYNAETNESTITNFVQPLAEDFKLIGTNQLLWVSSVGFGCTLIHRSVLERISFKASQTHASDSFFFNECAEKLISVYLDTDTYINHFNNDWGVFINKSVIV